MDCCWLCGRPSGPFVTRKQQGGDTSSLSIPFAEFLILSTVLLSSTVFCVFFVPSPLLPRPFGSCQSGCRERGAEEGEGMGGPGTDQHTRGPAFSP